MDIKTIELYGKYKILLFYDDIYYKSFLFYVKYKSLLINL